MGVRIRLLLVGSALLLLLRTPTFVTGAEATIKTKKARSGDGREFTASDESSPERQRRATRVSRALWAMQAVAKEKNQREFSLLEMKEATRTAFKWLNGEDPSDFDFIFTDAIQELATVRAWGALVHGTDGSTGLPVIRVSDHFTESASKTSSLITETSAGLVGVSTKIIFSLLFVVVTTLLLLRRKESWLSRTLLRGRFARPDPEANDGEVAREPNEPAAAEDGAQPIGHPNEAVAQEEEHHEPALECPICWAKFLPGERICSIPCGHVFHVACLDLWQSERCPVCNSPNNVLNNRRVLYFM